MELYGAVATALWLGIMTSISPCPLATNIAAISFISRTVDRPGAVAWTGLFYTAGRTLVYVVLGAILAASLISMPVVSQWLQKYMNQLLGPVLILVSMFLLELITISSGGGGLKDWAQKKAQSGGLFAAFLLGVVFALSFCPVSAALFFGSLVPLSVASESRLIVPALYGVGTALPVLLFAGTLCFSANRLATIFRNITAFELWARRSTGSVFLLVGIYFTLRYTLQLF